MQITMNVADVIKRIEGKQAKLEKRKAEIKAAQVAANSKAKVKQQAAIREAIATLQGVLDSGDLFKSKLVYGERAYESVNKKKYRVGVKVLVSRYDQESLAIQGVNYEVKRLNEYLTRIATVLKTLRMSSVPTMIVDSEAGDYYGLLNL